MAQTEQEVTQLCCAAVRVRSSLVCRGPVMHAALKSPRCVPQQPLLSQMRCASRTSPTRIQCRDWPPNFPRRAQPRSGSFGASSLASARRSRRPGARCRRPCAVAACSRHLVCTHRPPLASEDSEGPESSTQYADVNQLLRALHFERLLRLQSRSPQPPLPDATQLARSDKLQ